MSAGDERSAKARNSNQVAILPLSLMLLKMSRKDRQSAEMLLHNFAFLRPVMPCAGEMWITILRKYEGLTQLGETMICGIELMQLVGCMEGGLKEEMICSTIYISSCKTLGPGVFIQPQNMDVPIVT